MAALCWDSVATRWPLPGPHYDVYVFICAAPGKYTPADLQYETDRMNDTTGAFYARESSGQAAVRFLPAAILTPSIDWDNTHIGQDETLWCVYEHGPDPEPPTDGNSRPGHMSQLTLFDVSPGPRVQSNWCPGACAHWTGYFGSIDPAVLGTVWMPTVESLYASKYICTTNSPPRLVRELPGTRTAPPGKNTSFGNIRAGNDTSCRDLAYWVYDYLVAHELGHALFGFGHPPDCSIMSGRWECRPVAAKTTPGARLAAVLLVVCLAVPVLAVPAGAHGGPAVGGGGNSGDARALAGLAGAQEALLNAYRCMFAVDVEVVPGGCANGAPAAVGLGDPAAGGSVDVAALRRLVTDQEALLNAYRCMFAVDVEVVPGGCVDGRPAAVGPVAGEEAEDDRGAGDESGGAKGGERVECSESEHCLVSFSGRGGKRWCGLRDDQVVICTHIQGIGPAALGPYGPNAGRFLSVSAGLFYACGLREDRNVKCWDYQWPPAVVAAAEGRFLSVSAGIAFGEFACGIRDDQTAVCWGRSDRTGRLDAPAGRFLSVSAGWQHACGIREDQTVVCWGDNTHGRLDPPEGRFTSISAGFWFSCGIREDRTATCWGNNLRRGYNAPAGRFLEVSAGQGLACGLREDQTVVCWGPPTAGTFGELDEPAGRFVSVSAGSGQACGLRPDGTLECWGEHAMSWDNTHFHGRPLVHAVYAVPAGEAPVTGRQQLIADAIAEVQEWFRSQTGGRHLLFAREGDRVSIAVVKLTGTGADREGILAELREQLGTNMPFVVFGEGDFPAAGTGRHWACAHGGWDVMISIRRCRRDYLPGELSRVLAHELVHLLGAAQPCAPNYAGPGHVDDDRRDILFYQHTGMGLGRLVLDVGRDDYYGHGRDDCYDIADSPLLVHAGREPSR